MPFYYPNECGGCGRTPDFGEEFLPYLARTLVGKHRYPVDDGASTIYLCNSCTGIVAKAGTIQLEEVVQYRIKVSKPLTKRPPQYWRDQYEVKGTDTGRTYKDEFGAWGQDQQDAYKWAAEQMGKKIDQDIYDNLKYGSWAQQQAPSKSERVAETFAAKYGFAKPPKMSDEEFRQRLLNLLYNKDK